MNLRNLGLTLTLLAGPALPAADSAAVAAALKRPADASVYPQAGAVVLLDERIVTLHPDGSTTTEGHRLIRILQDRARRSRSDQKIAFRGASQSCEVLTALTHLPSGETRKAEANGIMEVSDPEAARAPFYSTARLKVVSFPGVQAGAALELKYLLKPLPQRATEDDPGFFSGWAEFGGEDPVLEKTLVVRVPEGTPLAFQLFNGLADPRISTEGGTTQYVWTARDRPQIIRESNAVPNGELVPRVVFTTARNPTELGRWLWDRFDSAALPDAAVKAKAVELAGALPGPEAKVERLALFVTQEIRNVNLALGRVGFRPTPAAAILANRYADPRDKFTLFRALLRGLDLDARPVLVHRDRTRLSGLACLDEYQGLLAQVSLPSGPRLYDLGLSQGRLGMLLPSVAGCPALRVTPAGAEPMTTPAVTEGRQFARAQWTLAVEPGGDLAARIVMTFDGLFDADIRSRLSGRNEDSRRVFLQGVADGLRKGARLERFEVSDLLDLTRAPVISMDIRVPRFASRQGDMMVLNLPANLVPLGAEPFRPTLPTVVHPCRIPATYRTEAELSIQLPEGYRIAYQPEPASLRQPAYAFDLDCAAQGSRLLLKRTAVWREAVIAPGEYGALWEAQARACEPGSALILLEK